MTSTLREATERPRPVRRRVAPRLHDMAVLEGAHRSCLQAARAGACHTCITIVDAIIDRSQNAAKQRRLAS